MNSKLVDPTGIVWDTGSGRLRLKYHSRIDSDVLPDYLVRNHGYVEVSSSTKGCTLRFAPGQLKYDCYVATIGLIEGHSNVRATLAWYDGQWHYEFVRGARALAKRFLALKLEHAEKLHDRYFMLPRTISSIEHCQQHSALLDFWKAHSGRIDVDRCREQISEMTGGKYLAISRSEATGALQFKEIGKGLITYQDHKWAEHSQGNPVEIQPDMRYGAWIANTYRQALVVGQPDFSEVEAVIAGGKNGSLVHHIYTRLILPVETDDGGRELLSAPLINRSVTVKV
ncbi:MAG: hypothetical protein AAF346_02625 [Pseudomonadota bacterium]